MKESKYRYAAEWITELVTVNFNIITEFGYVAQIEPIWLQPLRLLLRQYVP
jgi:hypothetical protein